MNSDDLLEKATRAFREHTSQHANRGEETWLRIERKIKRVPRKKTWVRMISLQLAAAILVLGTWAGATGRLHQVWFQLVKSSFFAPTVMDEKHTREDVKKENEIENTNQVESDDATHHEEIDAGDIGLDVYEPKVEKNVLPVLSSSQKRTTQVMPKGKETILNPSHEEVSKPDLVKEDPESLYWVAHKAHFITKDPQKALIGWQDYLRETKGAGRYAIEARYNIGICLVRLGRREEAVKALRPFASGEYGSYRQREAQSLIQAIMGDGG